MADLLYFVTVSLFSHHGGQLPYYPNRLAYNEYYGILLQVLYLEIGLNFWNLRTTSNNCWLST